MAGAAAPAQHPEGAIRPWYVELFGIWVHRGPSLPFRGLPYVALATVTLLAATLLAARAGDWEWGT